jgi:two-component system CheB/CheR fusion protein
MKDNQRRSKKNGRKKSGEKKLSSDGKTLQQETQKLQSISEDLIRSSKKLHRRINKGHHAVKSTHRQVKELHPQKLFAAPSAEKKIFHIVGIGASAGGLEAATQLLKSLSPDTGMAFVLVQHLDPTHESALTALLAGATRMVVTEARDGMRLEPNRLYIMPPNKRIAMAKRRRLHLSRRPIGDEHRPIDAFFESLAKHEGQHAIGIVLSGNGSDGTNGLKAIRDAGGITFAQDEKTAKYPGMPGSAITAGCVNYILSPEQIAAELKRVGKTEFVPEVKEPATAALQKGYDQILLLLRQRTGVDFTYYKKATLQRRMHRRMLMHKLNSLKDYSHYVRENPAEVQELFNDVLIRVTGFFRDPGIFQILRKKVFPRLLQGKPSEEPLRIWIPGCATGEEVYSVAMLLTELMEEKKNFHPVQIFGTDINEAALNRARTGLYPEDIKTVVSAERLRRFFVKSDGGYRVSKMIREMCIFARQNLVNDPPFSNLDLISCRNVLIYLGPELQRKLLPMFHYTLRLNGLLMLGASETIGSYAELFSLVDKKAKIYVKRASLARLPLNFSHALAEPAPGGNELAAAIRGKITPTLTEVQKQADRIILASYTLPGVVVNQDFEVLQFRGRTGPFLEHSHGEATLNIMKMAREGLMPELRTALLESVKRSIRVRRENLRVRQNGHYAECSFEVIPFAAPPATEKFYLVLFEHANGPRAEDGEKGASRRKLSQARTERAELAQLREELASTRESLQTIIEEQEATNEELRSANEEIISSNEELQSTNEELETAKEELQSTNEELTTLNDELESRNTELEHVNNDLQNVLASVNIPVLILGSDLKIRRFTGFAEKMFKLIPSDVGRPITDMNLPLHIPRLDRLVLEVLDTLIAREIEVQDRDNHWWSVRIRPYKTTDQKIDGAVITLVDIDAVKIGMKSAMRHGEIAETIVDTVREPLLVLDKKLVITSANHSFYRAFKVRPQETLQRSVSKLGNGQWAVPELKTMLEKILREKGAFENFEIEHKFPRIGNRKMVLNGRYLEFEHETGPSVLLAFEDVTVK